MPARAATRRMTLQVGIGRSGLSGLSDTSMKPTDGSRSIKFCIGGSEGSSRKRWSSD